jgi:hypothetical protein
MNKALRANEANNYNLELDFIQTCEIVQNIENISVTF